MKKHPFMKDRKLMESKDQTMIEPDLTQSLEGAPKQGLLDTTFTLRQVRNYFLLLLIALFVLYVWQFFKLAWHSKMGGLRAQNSPYYQEIPDDCKKFSDRHSWFTNAPDNLALRIRGIRLKDNYLQPDYGSIRCLGYSVLTGLHMQDPLDANFTDTYTDYHGKPIVRITVEYLQTYQYDPSQRKELKEAEKK
jgi:hypothetical protein